MASPDGPSLPLQFASGQEAMLWLESLQSAICAANNSFEMVV